MEKDSSLLVYDLAKPDKSPEVMKFEDDVAMSQYWWRISERDVFIIGGYRRIYFIEYGAGNVYELELFQEDVFNIAVDVRSAEGVIIDLIVCPETSCGIA